MARRVSLRAAVPADAQTIDSWLTEAVAAVKGLKAAGSAPAALTTLLAQLSPSHAAITVVWRDQAVGLSVIRQGKADRAIVEFLAIAAPQRNLGLGSEAVYALERMNGPRNLYAAVPLANGLAIYFWLRTGYRPLYPDLFAEAPASGYVWMRRGSVEPNSLPGQPF